MGTTRVAAVTLTNRFRNTKAGDWSATLEAINGAPIVGAITYLDRHDENIEITLILGGLPIQFWVPLAVTLTIS